MPPASSVRTLSYSQHSGETCTFFFLLFLAAFGWSVALMGALASASWSAPTAGVPTKRSACVPATQCNMKVYQMHAV
jgi:hypothetical protein